MNRHRNLLHSLSQIPMLIRLIILTETIFHCVYIHISSVTAFSSHNNPITAEGLYLVRKRNMHKIYLNALTDRQMQFWEDCESGLDDIERVFASRGQNIDRIREFGKSARGEIEFPKPQAPYHEPSEENVPNLSAKPFWDDIASDSAQFPWAKPLEENFQIILNEFNTVVTGDPNMYSADSAWQNQVMGEGWSAVRLKRLGVWNTENCKKFPETYNLLNDLNIPFAVRGVCFARQAPGSGVAPHSDGRNFILTSHLGLQIPKEAWIKVGDKTRNWEVGRLITLDTSFQHSTKNPSDTMDRYVLIIDFWHPELTEAEREGLEFIYDLRNRFESGQVPVRPLRNTLMNTNTEKDNEKSKNRMGIWNSLFQGKK